MNTMMPAILLTILVHFCTSGACATTITLPSAYEAPDYGSNLKTCVRLRSVADHDAGNYKDYDGMELMFETTDSNGRFVWAGNVSFMPKGGRSNLSLAFARDSKVTFHYIVHNDYKQENRNYGTRKKPKSKMDSKNWLELDGPLKIHYSILNPDSNDTKLGKRKRWIQYSLFEWTLSEVYTIQDIADVLKTFMEKDSKAFPKHLLYGYSSDGGCLNCVTFSCLVLEKVGVDFSQSPMINGYLEHYPHRTGWGRSTSVLRWAGTSGQCAAAAAGGFALGGPVGACVGLAGAGAVAWLGADGGVLMKGSLNRVANLKNIASPKRFVSEMYNRRQDLGLSIVRTKTPGGFSYPSSNAKLLDFINAKRSFWSGEIKAFPDDCTFVDYYFEY